MTAPLTASAVASTTSVTLTFHSPGMGNGYDGTVSVPQSPTRADWKVTLGGTIIGSFIGRTGFGPFRWTGSVPLKVISTGPTLVNGTQYTACLVGIAARGTAPFVTPTPQVVTTVRYVPNEATPLYTGPFVTHSGAAFSLTVTLTTALSAMVVAHSPHSTTTTKPMAYCAVVELGKFFTVIPTSRFARFVAPFGSRTVVTSDGAQIAVIPIGLVTSATTATVSIYTSGAGASAVGIWGLTENPDVSLQADGRAYPLGNLNGTGTIFKNASATAAVVSAPTSPLRVLVKSASLVTGTATGHVGNLQVIQANGTKTLVVAYQVKGGVAVNSEPPGGVLLDPGQGVDLKAFTNGTTTVSGTAVVHYDLVV